MILPDNFPPQLRAGGIFLNLPNRSLELLNNTPGCDTTKLRVGRAKGRLSPHYDFLTRASDHRAGRHCELRNYGDDIITEATTNVFYYSLRSGKIAARSVQN